jgi:general secretion pathway protein L
MLRPIGVSEHLRAFGRWWLGEFLALFPRPVANWLIERGSRTLILGLEEDTVTFQLMSDRRRLVGSARIGRTKYSADAIDAFLRSHRLRRRDVSLGLRLPASSVFCRSFALPLETRRSLDAIVVQDLLAKTPFQLDAIRHAHVAHRLADQFVVSQWIVRRGHVAEAVEALGLQEDEVAFVESPGAGTEGAPLPVIRLQPAAARRGRWIQRALLTLGAAALALTVVALWAKYDRQQQLLDNLEVEVGAARVKAKAVLAAIDRLEQQHARLARLRAMRSEPGLLDVWEEATRILPAHTWLSELRLSEAAEGRQVVMTGLSAAAASLVPLIDQSAIFAEASLAGPISVDQAENRERFMIQAGVGKLAKPRTVAR